jgi:hypothetical protein
VNPLTGAQTLISSGGLLVEPMGVVSLVMPRCDGPTPGVAWKNHGAFVSVVVHIVEALVATGIIPDEAKGALVSEAAHSDCGKTK